MNLSLETYEDLQSLLFLLDEVPAGELATFSLNKAITMDIFRVAEKILELGVDVNDLDSEGKLPLMRILKLPLSKRRMFFGKDLK